MIYIKEAHPEEGWVLEFNRKADIMIHEPKTLEERADVAGSCALSLKLEIPMLLDAIDNTVASRYGGWPDRLYLIDREGKIVYQGEEGPFGFKPELLERAIREELKAT